MFVFRGLGIHALWFLMAVDDIEMNLAVRECDG